MAGRKLYFWQNMQEGNITMIKKINIKNFQSHKNSELNFIPGVNVIIGNSSSGKSAIMRAFRWVITNKPSGDSFMSHWKGGDTECAIQIEQKNIQRIKSNKENIYKIQKEIFRSFGKDTPEIIKKTLNFSEINLQTQFDFPFLIFDSPGNVAQYLNRVVNLDIIDFSLSKIEINRKKINREIFKNQSDIKEKQEQIKRFDYIDKLEIKLNELENKNNELVKKQKEYSDIYKLIEEQLNIKKELNHIKKKNIDKQEEIINKLLELNKNLDRTKEQYNNINFLIKEYSDINNKIKFIKKIYTDKNEKTMNMLLKQQQILNEFKEKREDINSFINIYRNHEKKHKDVQKKLFLLVEEEKKLTKGLKICPLCKQKIL